jgi:hypothetical protein
MGALVFVVCLAFCFALVGLARANEPTACGQLHALIGRYQARYPRERFTIRRCDHRGRFAFAVSRPGLSARLSGVASLHDGELRWIVYRITLTTHPGRRAHATLHYPA